jgi:hypothetical protein
LARLARFTCLLDFRDGYGLLDHLNSDGFDCWSGKRFYFPCGLLHWRAFQLGLGNCPLRVTFAALDTLRALGRAVAAFLFCAFDEMLTVNRLGLPAKLRRSLACTNSIENMMGTVRRVCRNVKQWQNTAMALRWTAAGILEAAKDSVD